MKSNKFTYLLVAGLALTVAMTGCRKKNTYPTPLPGHTGPINGGGTGDPGNGGTLGGGDASGLGGSTLTGFPAGNGHPGWTQNASQFEAQTVYFDFDSATIKGSEKSKIEIVSAYLQANPNSAVLVEGNCDERGTEEYNRALGELRALAAREILISAGIAADRVDTISYGEDKPADSGHSESAWKKNRRDNFILLTPP